MGPKCGHEHFEERCNSCQEYAAGGMRLLDLIGGNGVPFDKTNRGHLEIIYFTPEIRELIEWEFRERAKNALPS